MCGIFGIFNPSSDIPEQTYKTAFMNGSRRGPENSVFQTIGTQAYLGFHRLAINGLNNASNQPLRQGNLTLICNGDIYNYKRLYEILGSPEPLYEFDGEKMDSTAFQARTQSDCEIILHLYRKFGIEQTLQLLDGVFAFILIDYDIYSDSAKMYAARDPFGVRPLYQLQCKFQCKDLYTNTMLGFASELKCLSEFGRKAEPFQPGTYSAYSLGFQVGDRWQLQQENVRFYLPAVIGFHSAIHNQEDPVGKVEDDTLGQQMREAFHRIHAGLIEAVYKRCAATERPVACLLSGGLDSSLITALVAQYHRENELPYPLETYSIGLEGSVDLVYAQKVADHLKTKHTEIVLQESDFVEAIPEVIRAIESYDTTTVRASIGNYLLGKYIRANSDAKVIFNGDGSDELTGGYLYFQCAPNSIEFDFECRRLLRDIHLFDVLRSDKSISSHGLEPRTPFLDRGFVQTYLSIPMELRNHASNQNASNRNASNRNASNRCEKYMLRAAFDCYIGNLLPDEVLWRKKEAFSDGVSKTSRSLFEIIQEHVEKIYETQTNNSSPKIEEYRSKYPHNPPQTWEQVYYREIFEESYPGQGHVVPYMWMPRFVKGATDASARTLSIYAK